MSKLLVVVGATGGQGGSVVKAMREHSRHSFKIRGITRNTNSGKAKALSAQGIEMVAADLNDESSLVQAFQGASAIFAVTDFYETFRTGGPWTAMDTECRRGLNMARAALQIPTLEHYIWSTPSAYKISEKRFFVPHLEAKARVDEFIKQSPLLEKTTFFWITFFDSNLLKPTFQPILFKPLRKRVLLLPSSPSTLYGFVGDPSVNIGVFVRAALAQPDKTLKGKYVFGNVETLSISEFLERWGTVTGKSTQYIQVASEEYCKLFPGYGAEMASMLQFWDAYGEKAWSGEELLTGRDLGVEKELVGLESSWRRIDWSPID